MVNKPGATKKIIYKSKKYKRLHLRHHRHSGRLLPHRHTSYGALVFLMIVFCLLLASFNAADSISALTQTSSGSIGLTGLVKGPPPTTPATILSPTNGQTFQTNLITVRGSCGPNLLVKIFRDGILAGSQVCQVDGTFSLSIQLIPGRNVLRARNYDFADQPGPDSPDVIVDWSSASVSSSPSGQQSSPPSDTSSAKPGNLIVTTEKAYYVAAIGDHVVWPFVISGGQAPYAVLIDWGDGQQELKSLANSGKFEVSHIYKKADQYKVALKVTDASGATGFIQIHAIIRPEGAFGMSSQVLPKTEQTDLYYTCWMSLAITSVGLLCFWLGEYFGMSKIRFRLTDKSPGR